MKKIRILALSLAAILTLASCGQGSQIVDGPFESGDASEVVEMAPEYLVEDDVPLAGGGGGSGNAPTVTFGADGSYKGTITIVENKAPGTTAYTKGGSTIDASNASKGYVMVKQTGVDKRLKVQIVMGDKKYNYDLNNKGNYEAFPLQFGDGTYKIRILQNKEGNTYSELFSAQIQVKLDPANSVFLAPNQYVNYNASSTTIKKAFDLCSGAKSDLEKLQIIYSWIISNITYDTNKAKNVQTGYLPDVDAILKSKTGICFDYAAMMAAMLRSQGIPTKLVIGTVSAADLNHAWNEVYLEGKGWVTVRVYFEGSKWERMDPTFAAGDSKNEQYTGDGSNYTTKRVY